jgi:hypothetical protein
MSAPGGERTGAHRGDGAGEGEPPPTAAQERAEELAGRFGEGVARFAARAAGRAREEAEDVWAEAQTLRGEAPAPLRRGLAYGLAGVMRAGDVIVSAARGMAGEPSRGGRGRAPEREGQSAERAEEGAAGGAVERRRRPAG